MRDPLVLMTERRAEQRILAVAAFYIVQSGFGCNCLGRGSDRTVPRNDPDGTFRKRLLPVLLIQTVALRRENNHSCELQ